MKTPAWLIALVVMFGVVTQWELVAEEALSVRPGHPRLLAHAEDFRVLRARAATDAQLAALVRGIETEARALLDEAPVRRDQVGRRLLAVSRRALHRIGLLAFAYRMTDDVALARRAEREMLAAAAFSDWNPSHFLDVGEMTAALAVGYDWLFDVLSVETRTTIRRAIVEKGLKQGRDPAARHNSWHKRDNNWNQVCWGGLTLGALAIADEEPEIAREILALARANIGNGLKPYMPDGIYPEGPAYWAYGTSYQVLMIAALESALGTDWGLRASPGFMESAGVLLQTTGATGRSFNFADGGERASLDPAMFWFARSTENPGLLLFHARANGREAANLADRFGPLAALWWPQGSLREVAPHLPLRWRGGGEQPLGVFRSSWTDSNALYLAFKGGAASLNHAHMDAGSFVFEADGVRWASDLGAQSYESLESKGVDLWNRKQDSERWQVFRLNNCSHNTLVIDDQLQRVDGHAAIVKFSDAAATAFGIVDLSPVYATQATRVWRGFRLVGERRVLVQDELEGLKPDARVRWAMVTRADVAVDGASATLRADGKHLDVRLLAPAGARFEVIAADPPNDGFNAPNPGYRILVAHTTAIADGSSRLAVLLTPGSASDDLPPPELAALSAWEPLTTR